VIVPPLAVVALTVSDLTKLQDVPASTRENVPSALRGNLTCRCRKAPLRSRVQSKKVHGVSSGGVGEDERILGI